VFPVGSSLEVWELAKTSPNFSFDLTNTYLTKLPCFSQLYFFNSLSKVLKNRCIMLVAKDVFIPNMAKILAKRRKSKEEELF
jgi:hypothetical protein